jgi:hypothetical protein
MPTDIKVFLDNTTPKVNFNEVSGPSKPLTEDTSTSLVPTSTSPPTTT